MYAIVHVWNPRDRHHLPLTLSSRYLILVLCKTLCISNNDHPCDEPWTSDIADIKLAAFFKASESGLRHPPARRLGGNQSTYQRMWQCAYGTCVPK